jgi:hypothetical protein
MVRAWYDAIAGDTVLPAIVWLGAVGMMLGEGAETLFEKVYRSLPIHCPCCSTDLLAGNRGGSHHV